MAAMVSSTWFLVFSTTSSGSARSRASLIWALSAAMTGLTADTPRAAPAPSPAAAIALPALSTPRRVGVRRRNGGLPCPLRSRAMSVLPGSRL
jgi:hypothetical protein